MKEELINLKRKLLKQAEACQQRMLATNDKHSWDYGYNHGAKDCAMMIVNSLNDILENGNN